MSRGFSDDRAFNRSEILSTAKISLATEDQTSQEPTYLSFLREVLQVCLAQTSLHDMLLLLGLRTQRRMDQSDEHESGQPLPLLVQLRVATSQITPPFERRTLTSRQPCSSSMSRVTSACSSKGKSCFKTRRRRSSFTSASSQSASLLPCQT